MGHCLNYPHLIHSVGDTRLVHQVLVVSIDSCFMYSPPSLAMPTSPLIWARLWDLRGWYGYVFACLTSTNCLRCSCNIHLHAWRHWVDSSASFWSSILGMHQICTCLSSSSHYHLISTSDIFTGASSIRSSFSLLAPTSMPGPRILPPLVHSCGSVVCASLGPLTPDSRKWVTYACNFTFSVIVGFVLVYLWWH